MSKAPTDALSCVIKFILLCCFFYVVIWGIIIFFGPELMGASE